MVGGLAGIWREVFGTRWSGPAACAWLSRFRVEMPARSQRCLRFIRPEMIAISVQKSKLVGLRKGVSGKERRDGWPWAMQSEWSDSSDQSDKLARGERLVRDFG